MVKIRLRRVGAKKQPHYRVVVTDSRSPRDGKFIETIGHYNPRTEPPTIEIDAERALYWLSVGAQPSEAVKRMLDKMGVMSQVPVVRRGEVSIDEILAQLETAKAEAAALEAEVPEAEAELVEAVEEEVEAEVELAEAVEEEVEAEAELAEAVEEEVEAEAELAEAIEEEVEAEAELVEAVEEEVEAEAELVEAKEGTEAAEAEAANVDEDEPEKDAV